jgi:hypothetical protein
MSSQVSEDAVTNLMDKYWLSSLYAVDAMFVYPLTPPHGGYELSPLEGCNLSLIKIGW